MTDQSPLDAARAAMDAAPDDERLRLAFYARLADSDLSVLLASEARGATLDPDLFETESGTFVLAFESEAGVASFAGGPALYAALPGRLLARSLAGQGVGLALNLDAPERAALIPAEAVDWLAEVLARRPDAALSRPTEVARPAGLPEALLSALDARLARAAGLARHAYLAQVSYEDGSTGHLLGVTGAEKQAEPLIARAVNEALIFSGLDAGALDVAFLADDDPLAERLARVALRFDLPQAQRPAEPRGPAAPGSDPNRPPRLR